MQRFYFISSIDYLGESVITNHSPMDLKRVLRLYTPCEMKRAKEQYTSCCIKRTILYYSPIWMQ